MLAAGHLNEWELGENFFLGVGVGEEGQRAFAWKGHFIGSLQQY